MHLRAEGTSDDGSLYPHHCDRCGKRFTLPAGLRTHMKYVHEGIKDDVTCSICSMTFDRRTKMQSHKRQAHPQNNRHQCKYCLKNLVYAGALKIHLNKHEEPKFKCRFCEKSLKSVSALKAHERQHTGEKPYKCSACGTGFTSQQGVGQHERGVHGIAPRGGKTGWFRKEKQKEVN